jgi:hypothetical protein
LDYLKKKVLDHVVIDANGLSLMQMVCHLGQWFDYLGDCWIICKWYGLIDVID